MGRLSSCLIVFSALVAVLPANGQPVVVARPPSNMPSGSWSSLEIVVKGAGNSGPCRLELGFPAGFSFRPVSVAGGSLYVAGTSLNVAWSSFPAGRELLLKVEVMPDRSVSGEVGVTGRFYYVSSTGVRNVEPVAQFSIVAGGSVDTDRPAAVTGEGSAKRVVSTVVTPPEGNKRTEGMVVYRVQLLTSSARMTGKQLQGRLGVRFAEPVTVTPAGNAFRYQAGDCPTFECAERLLEFFVKAGVEGPFIVAFIDGRQVSPAEARQKSGRLD